MKFARNVFFVAGAWGMAVLTPLFFLVDLAGTRYAPPLNHPHFFYGFLAVALVWQFAFLLIGSAPVRYRPFMPLAVLEKAGFVVVAVVLHAQGQITAAEAAAAIPDAVLGVCFVAAFVKTRGASAT